MIQMTAISSKDSLNAQVKSLAQIRARAKKHLKVWANIFREEYRKTTASWKRQPIFTMKFESLPEGEQVIIGTDNIIYRYLHDGTKVRWAVMTPDYEAKTVPRLLGSRPGKGYAHLRGQKKMFEAGYLEAKPGIDAREWTKRIIEIYEKPFQTSMDKVVFGDFK